MSTTSSDLRYDPTTPDYAKDPYPILTRLRQEAPIYQWEAGKGVVFFRYRDVIALLRETRLSQDPTLGAGFPPQLKQAFPDFVALQEHGLFMVPPAAHARLRRLLNPVFGPRSLEAYKPTITAVIQSLLDKLPLDGTVNFYEDFARLFPVRVIAAILNIPPGREADFLAFSEATIVTLTRPNLPPEVFASYMPAMSKGMRLVESIIAERRQHPMPNDLLSDLIHACDADDRLNEAELVSLIAALLVAGSDTTVHMTTYTMHNLLKHPEQLAALRAEPSLARGALDESLRYTGFGRGGLMRYVAEPFTYEGISFQRGDRLFLEFMAAFRDPECLPDADVYDIRRTAATSPWFGFGPHFCLGATIARMEGEIALRMFLERYPSIEISGELSWGSHPVMRDLVQMPLRVRATQA